MAEAIKFHAAVKKCTVKGVSLLGQQLKIGETG